MNHDQGQPNHAAIALANGDQDHAFPSSNDRVRPFPYWMATFDGRLLRQRRLERSLSQERLSYRSGVSLRTIQRVEKLSAATCHFGTLQRLARALSHNPDALMTELTARFSSPSASAQPARSRPDPWWQLPAPFPSAKNGHGRYDAATARELLAMTGEFPQTKGGMLILLTEYRHALHDIVTGPAGKSS